MNSEEWDKRVAAGRVQLERENRREAEVVNRMQNHCCLGMIAVYTFGIFFAFAMGRVREYPEVQATMVRLPSTHSKNFDSEHLPSLSDQGDRIRPTYDEDDLGNRIKNDEASSSRSRSGSDAAASTHSAGTPHASAPDVAAQPLQPHADTSPPEQSLPTPTVEQGDATALDPGRQYAASVNVQLQNATSSLQSLVSCLQEAVHHPPAIFNAEWSSESRTAVVNLRDASAQLSQIFPVPPAYRSVDSKAKRAGAASLAFLRRFAGAIDERTRKGLSDQPSELQIESVLHEVPALNRQLIDLGKVVDAASAAGYSR